ncbi:hypothetical protein Tco_1152822 [Tanacetum coccineum]
MWYTPRSPLVSIGGLYGDYLNKSSAARAAKQKHSEEFHPVLCGREKSQDVALIDHVRELKGICESLMTLPKDVKRGLYGDYLNKSSAARAAKQKHSEEFHPVLCGKEKSQDVALIDHVRELEGICESLLTLPKDVKSLR